MVFIPSAISSLLLKLKSHFCTKYLSLVRGVTCFILASYLLGNANGMILMWSIPVHASGVDVTSLDEDGTKITQPNISNIYILALHYNGLRQRAHTSGKCLCLKRSICNECETPIPQIVNIYRSFVRSLL